MENLGTISIITINYNNCNGLLKTIKSVISQTFTDYQYIIIDGGSDDGSVEVIKEYKDKIDYWVSEADNGIYHAMNKGIDRSTGEYCLFLNSGDVFHCKSTVQDVVDKGLDKDIILGTGVYSDGTVFCVQDRPFVFMDFWYKSPIPHPGAFIKRKLFDDNKYDEALKIVSDWKFFMTAIIERGCSVYCHRKLNSFATEK